MGHWVSPFRRSPSCCPCRCPPVVLCVSSARRPRDWGRRPGSEEPGERVGVLQRPPHVLDRPLRPCPSEILRLVIALPIGKSISVSYFRIGKSISVSYFRVRELPFAPGSWPRSTPSVVGQPTQEAVDLSRTVHHACYRLGLMGSRSRPLSLCLVCRR